MGGQQAPSLALRQAVESANLSSQLASSRPERPRATNLVPRRIARRQSEMQLHGNRLARRRSSQGTTRAGSRFMNNIHKIDAYILNAKCAIHYAKYAIGDAECAIHDAKCSIDEAETLQKGVAQQGLMDNLNKTLLELSKIQDQLDIV